MAKRKRTKFGQFSKLIAAVTALIAAFLIFAPVLGKDNASYTGLEITFGKDLGNFFGLIGGKLDFNILSLMAFALPIGAFIILFMSESKIGLLLATALTVTSLALFVYMPEFVKITVKIGNSVSYNTIEWQTLWGWTYAVVLLTISSLFNLYRILLSLIKC